MSMEQPPPQEFPKDYDPQAEVKEIMSGDPPKGSQDPRRESMSMKDKVQRALDKSRGNFMQGITFASSGAAAAYLTEVMGGRFPDIVSNLQMNPHAAEAFVGGLLTCLGVGAVAGVGGGMALMGAGFKKMREQPSEDGSNYNNSAEVLR